MVVVLLQGVERVSHPRTFPDVNGLEKTCVIQRRHSLLPM